LLATAWFSYGALLSNLNTLDDGSRTAEIIWGACVFGYCTSALIELIRPALFSSTDEFVTYRTALRTGHLPDGVDLPVWDRRLSRSRLAITVVPWFALPYLGFGALSADSSNTRYRVSLLWIFVTCGIGVLAWVFRRIARIKQLESTVRQRQERQRPEPVVPVEPAAPASRAMVRLQKQWKSNAETPMTQRIVTMIVVSGTLAFIALLLADLDAVVYSDNRGARVAWVALWASTIGVAATVIVLLDPRMRASNRTIEAILEYDWAFRAGELPAQFDVDQWRGWMKSQHQSDAVTLVWACFYLIVGCWSVVSHPSGYHWVLAILLAVVAIWHVHRWRYLCAMNARLETLVERHTVRQLFG
jgi:hypothetical protein